jgi:hypothetical protein
MLPFEDIAFQLINLPPISAERIEPWTAELLLSAECRVAGRRPCRTRRIISSETATS